MEYTYEQIRRNEEICTYIRQADESMAALGFTEHSFGHVSAVAAHAGYILETLGYPARTVELVKITGFLHDIGNIVNRIGHSQSGAIMAFSLLNKIGFSPKEIATICTAIGNHDEGTGQPVSELAAALILADKSDIRRNRVRETDRSKFDIHDRVNYSVTSSNLTINDSHTVITLSLTIDTEYSAVMEFFEIFMERMMLCRKAAAKLGLEFNLLINGQDLL